MCDSNDIRQQDSDYNDSLRQIVRRETEGGARLIRSLLAIAEGNANACTPWHQIEAAKLLLKIGGDPDAVTASASAQSKQQQVSAPAQPADATRHSDDVSHHSQDISRHSRDLSRHSCESRNPEGTEEGNPSCPSCESMSAPNPEYIKIHQRLAADIRIATYEGATMVRILTDILEGNDPDAKTRDRIDAAKLLHEWGFSNPHQPTPDQMLRLAPCHPDCLCACKGLPEDHPEVVEAHKPFTEEQRARIAEEQAKAEERDKRTAEFIEREMWNERQRKIAEFNSPTAKDDRRIEREELRKKRQRRKERKAAYELEQKRKRVEAISRQTALEMDFARDEELARVRARQSESHSTARPEPVMTSTKGPGPTISTVRPEPVEGHAFINAGVSGPDPDQDFYYEPLSPEDQALFNYLTHLESDEFEEGELTLKPPDETAREEYAANLNRIREAAASEGVPVLPNPLAGTLQDPNTSLPP